MENRRFAQHLLDNKHSIGSMEDIMEILHLTSKVSMMNTLERLYICIYIYEYIIEQILITKSMISAR